MVDPASRPQRLPSFEFEKSTRDLLGSLFSPMHFLAKARYGKLACTKKAQKLDRNFQWNMYLS
jgi:hypothetical protein